MMPSAPTRAAPAYHVPAEQYRIINILLDLSIQPEMQSFPGKDLYRIGDICSRTNLADCYSHHKTLRINCLPRLHIAPTPIDSCVAYELEK